MMADEEDIREVELSTIAAIYADELKVDEKDPFAFTIELPVSLSRPLVVKFPAASETAPPVPQAGNPNPIVNEVDSQELSNLPSLKIAISLPSGYPEDKPPLVKITTTPPWLPEHIIAKLEGDAERLWEEIGHDQVIFTYIDDVQQSTDQVFGLVDEHNTLEVGTEHKIAILDYDMEAKRKAFERGTFDCGICLDPKKGSVCHRMIDCGHVFCVQCLQDFYNNAITEGDIPSVRCLEPNCADKRDKAARQAAGGKRRKPKTLINPSELLQIPLDHDMVKRYVTLKHKSELESDKNTVYCPRSWCQGAARSKRHKKPEGLEFAEDTDDESGDEQSGDAKEKPKETDQDLLAICEDCGFAFCSRCGQSWHGEFKYCIPKERKDEISEEEKASIEYLQRHTTPCPTCAAPCQKTQGCNHMRCFRCQTHFCYLCSAWLNPENPYQHFNIQPSGEVNGCFMRLWELEGGDGDDVGIGYQGGPAVRRQGDPVAGPPGQQAGVLQQPPVGLIDVDDELILDIEQVVAPAPPAELVREAPPVQPPAAQIVAREGPLVLRIEGNAPVARREARGGLRGGGQQGAHAQQAPGAGHRGRFPAVNGGQRGGRGGRGARGRGGAVAGAGAGAGANAGAGQRQNRMQGPNQQANRGGRARDDDDRELEDEIRLAMGQMDDRDEVWVRNFVQLALHDQEHLLDEGDSGDEDD